MTRLTNFIRQTFAKIARDRRGAVSVVAAVAFTGLLGFAGLGTEASYWYVIKRNLQGSADSAALTGASAIMKGDTSSTITNNVAQAIANQYTSGASTPVSVTVNYPYAGNTGQIEVIMSQTPPRLFSALFMSQDPTIVGRAVGAVNTNTCSGESCGCILALDPNSVVDVGTGGAAQIHIPGCSMYVNSNNPNGALQVTGVSQITAYSTYIVGRKSVGAQAHLTDSAGTFENTARAMPDPYGNVAQPTVGACQQGTSAGNPLIVNSTNNAANPKVLDAGGGVMVLCGGVTVSGTGVLELKSGTYVMKGGHGAHNYGFEVQAGTVTSTFGGVTYNVTIFLTDTNGDGVFATADVAGGNVTLTAPTSGPYAGLAFYQDHGATATTSNNGSITTNSFNGGANFNVTGAIYFPNELVAFTGGAVGTNTATCTQVVAFNITFNGNQTFNSSCNSVGVASIGYSTGLVQ